MIRTASTVTMDDLKKYFTGGKSSESEGWRVLPSDMSIEAHSLHYDVLVEAKGFIYHIEVAAKDDPSDSDESVTDEPLKFLVEFLETGSSGDELFKKMSSDPSVLSGMLRLTARRLERDISSPKRTAAEIRRALIALNKEFALRAFGAIRKRSNRAEVEQKELADLKVEIERKGWEVWESKDDRDLPMLEINIGDEYGAKISVDHILWHYKFEVRGVDSVKEEGNTNDPIVAFRNWYRNPDVQEAKDDSKSEAVKPSDEETVAPRKAS